MLLKVLQWNVLDATYPMEKFRPFCDASVLAWPRRKHAIETLIAREQPDVVCLSEVHEEHPVDLGPDYDTHYMRKNLSQQGLFVGVRRARVQLKKIQKKFYKTFRENLENQNYFYLELEADGFRFALGTTHLKAGRGAQEQRLYETIELVSVMTQSGLPQLIVGDLNAERSERNVKHIFESLDLQSVNPELFTSLRLADGGRVQLKKIDYFFYSPQFELIAASNYQHDYNPSSDRCFFDKYPSDHIPTVATFKTPGAEVENAQIDNRSRRSSSSPRDVSKESLKRTREGSLPLSKKSTKSGVKPLK